MAAQIQVEGTVVGGILDPTFDRSYYSLVNCPRLGRVVGLDRHRGCDSFGGIHLDEDTGVQLLYCQFCE